jgi:hypothetical protein
VLSLERASLYKDVGIQYKFDILDKNMKYNKDENTIFLIQINTMNFSIHSNPKSTFKPPTLKPPKSTKNGDSGVLVALVSTFWIET